VNESPLAQRVRQWSRPSGTAWGGVRVRWIDQMIHPMEVGSAKLGPVSPVS